MTDYDPDTVLADGGTITLTAAQLHARTEPLDWKADGECAGADPSLWYPGRGEDIRPAKAICATCPVVEPCRDYGMAEKFGIWGGLSERERRRIRKARHLAVIAAAPDEAA